MRKTKSLLALALSAVLAMTGCSANRAADVVEEVSNQIESASDTTAEEIPTPTPEPTPAVTQAKLGDKAKVGDWEFTVKKVTVKKKIMRSKYFGYEPSKGNRFVCLSMSVKNNGAEEATFLPRMGYENQMNTAIIYYENKYEYKPTELSGYDKDIATKSIKPLTKKNGMIVFEVPKEVASHLGKATVKIGTTSESTVYPLKK